MKQRDLESVNTRSRIVLVNNKKSILFAIFSLRNDLLANHISLPSPLNLKNYHPISNMTSVQQKIDMCKEKPIRAEHIKNLLLPMIDIIASNKWLTKGVLFNYIKTFVT